MNNSFHPSSILREKYIDIIREGSVKAEKDGKLAKTQLAVIFEQQWPKMLAPVPYGGSQLQLPEALQTLEALAWADGSAGWLATLAATAGWLGTYFPAEIAKELFSNDKALVIADTDTKGTAEKTPKGYTISGKWPYAAGANDATAFVVSCVLSKNGSPAMENGEEQVLLFILFRNEVTITSSWNSLGLSATAGNSFEAKNAAMPANRAFTVTGNSSKTEGALYRFPYLQLLEAALALNISGMAFHFIDICQQLFPGIKTNNGVTLTDDHEAQDIFQKQTQKLYDARTKVYYAVELSWQACTHNQPIKPAIQYKVSAGALDLARKARECVDALYPYCGISAVDKASEINRVWRDLHTACQHPLLVFGAAME